MTRLFTSASSKSVLHVRALFCLLAVFTSFSFGSGALYAQTCPGISALEPLPPIICEGFPFSPVATGLSDVELSDNMEADFDIAFVYLPAGSMDDPYTAGILLGTATPDAGSATLFEVGETLAPGMYDVYAILSPAPANPACRPSAMTSIKISRCEDFGNLAFIDVNNNGVFNAGDAPLPGVLVWLYDADTDALVDAFDPVTTDLNGAYLFTLVPEGNYFLRTQAPSGYIATALPASLANNASHLNPGAGNGDLATADFFFSATAIDLTIDLGYKGTGSISGLIWPDDDFSNTPNEPGTNGVGISLAWWGPDGVWSTSDDISQTVSSSGGGTYQFQNLPFGEYKVRVASTAGTVLAQGYELAAPTLEHTVVISADNAGSTAADFVFQPSCLPSTGMLSTSHSLVFCGNAALGIYPDQAINLQLSGFIAPLSIPDDYVYWVLVTNAANTVVQAIPVSNPLATFPASIDLTGYPTGSYTIRMLHYLATDPDFLAAPFNVTVGMSLQTLIDRISLLDSQDNPAASANVCGRLTMTTGTLTAGMEPQPPVFLGCIADVNVSLNDACQATVTPNMVLNGTWGCLRPHDFRVSIYQNNQLISSNGQLSGCGTYQYYIELLVPGISGFPCWGNIHARDTRAPQIACPADISGGTNTQGAWDFYCSDINQLRFNTPVSYIVDGDGTPVTISPAVRQVLDVTGYPTVLDGCDFVRIYIADQLSQDPECGNTVLVRTFFAEDKVNSSCSGLPNMSNICTQRITFQKPTVDDVILPPNIVELDCAVFGNGPNPTPEAIGAATGNLSHPAVFTFFDANTGLAGFNPHLLNQVYCNLGAAYQDGPRISACGNTYSFLREWTLLDDCNPGDVQTFTQLIKIKDNNNPTMVLPTADYDGDGLNDVIRYSTSAGDCNAYIVVPQPTELLDVCSMPVTVQVRVLDNAGNLVATRQPGQVVVLPLGGYRFEYCATDACGRTFCAEMPIIVRDEIAPSMVCDDDLTVAIGGGDINNNLFGIARLNTDAIDEGSTDNCSALTFEVRRNLWQNGACSDNPNRFSDWGPTIDFLCCDVGREVTIELRATDAAGNSNSCWLSIVPEDKLRPTCTAPASQTITCTDWQLAFAGDIVQAYADDFGATSLMMNGIFGAPTGNDNCAVDTLVERTPTININNCGWGSIVRRFEAWQVLPQGDLNGNGRIDSNEALRSTNTCTQTITITPVHEYTIDFPEDSAADCLNPEAISTILSAVGCDNLVINVSEPQRFTSTGDECYKLAITYDVINWCVWDGEYEGYVLPRMTEDDGEPLPINRAVEGNERPVVRVLGNVATIDRRHTDRNGNSSIPDEVITPDRGRWIYTRFIKVYDTTNPEITVLPYGGPTEECPNLVAGEFPALDNVNCTGNVVIEFNLDDGCELFNSNGDLVLTITEASIDWNANDANQNGNYESTEFSSEGSVLANILSTGGANFRFETNAPIIPSAAGAQIAHVLRIVVRDACGNFASRYLPFKVIDCKPAAPICINGITVTLMPNEDGNCEGMLTAASFLASPVPDCSGPLRYAIYHAQDVLNAGESFVPNPVDTTLLFTAEQEGDAPVYIFAIDQEGNFDYCETYAQVQLNRLCLALGAIRGMVATENDMPVPNVRINLSGPEPMTTFTSPDGGYVFEYLEEDFDYTVTASLDEEPRRGVTTHDIVLISKHILGVQLLNSPYKRIAGDVNRSGSITTLDIIHIRKLILFVYDRFPDNTSWRFIDENYQFPVPENPWLEFFPELVNINDLIGEFIRAGFIAVKIGDVNGSASF